MRLSDQFWLFISCRHITEMALCPLSYTMPGTHDARHCPYNVNFDVFNEDRS